MDSPYLIRPLGAWKRTDLMKLKVVELKELARKHEVHGFAQLNHDPLVELLLRAAKEQRNQVDLAKPLAKWTRAQLDALSNGQLKNLVKYHGVKGYAGKNHDAVVDIVLAAQSEAKAPAPEKKPAVKKEAKEKSESEQSDLDLGKHLAKWTREELDRLSNTHLKELAKHHGVKGCAGKNHAVMVDIITAAQEPAPDKKKSSKKASKKHDLDEKPEPASGKKLKAPKMLTGYNLFVKAYHEKHGTKGKALMVEAGPAWKKADQDAWNDYAKRAKIYKTPKADAAKSPGDGGVAPSSTDRYRLVHKDCGAIVADGLSQNSPGDLTMPLFETAHPFNASEREGFVVVSEHWVLDRVADRVSVQSYTYNYNHATLHALQCSCGRRLGWRIGEADKSLRFKSRSGKYTLASGLVELQAYKK
jgi:acylphosphatase